MKISIKTKISLLYCLLFVFVMLLTSMFVYNSVNNYVIQSNLKRLSNIIAVNNNIFLRDAWQEHLKSDFAENIENIKDDYIVKPNLCAYIYNDEGILIDKNLQNYDSLPDSDLKAYIRQSLRGDNPYTIIENNMYIFIPIMYNKEALGVIEYVYPLADDYKTMGYLKKSFQIALAASIAAILMLSIFLSSIITNPLKDLTRAAEGFSAGKSIVLQYENNDEIGVLINTFNKMSESVMKHIIELDKEKSKLDIVLSSLTEGVAAFDFSDRIIFKNKAFEEIVDDNWIKIIKDLHVTIEADKQIIKDIERESSIYRIICTLKDRLFIIVLRDITLDKDIIEKQKRFVSNASHELKTPITSILGYAYYLKDSKVYDEYIMDYILNQAERLKVLIIDLLELSRLEDNKFSLDKKTTDLSELLSSIIENMKLKADKYKIRIQSEIEGNIVTLADGNKISQAMVNLLDNSIKYSKSGGSIYISLARNEKEIRISVADNGIGIPGDDVCRVFDRFYS